MNKMRLFTILLLAVHIPGGYGIKGGEIRDIRDFPHHVMIIATGGYKCGGGIISETHVLTAAHCVVNKNDRFYTDIKVLSGVNDSIRKNSGKVHEVALILCHGEYNYQYWWRNDIAILKLTAPISFSPLRVPISLRNSNIPEDATVTVTGYGFSYEKSPNTHLRSLRMIVISPEECGFKYRSNIDTSVICTIAYNQTDHQVVSGDSGNLLIYDGRAVGIVTAAVVVLQRGYPAIFTRMYDFLPWIEASMKRF